jgi:hypothetical protein
MTVLYCITWAVIAAGAVWAITEARTFAAMSRLAAKMREEISHCQDETSRARARAAQIARDAAIRAEGWKEGRDDVVAIIPLIVSPRDLSVPMHSADDGPETI